jgi:hypothetical protein
MARRPETLVGDWEKMEKFIRTLPETFKKPAEKLLFELAVETAKALKKQIRTQRMIDSGRYYKATDVYKEHRGSYYAGVPDEPHDKNNPKSINLRELAVLLELGTSKMHPRPHYQLVNMGMLKSAKKLIQNAGLRFLGRV